MPVRHRDLVDEIAPPQPKRCRHCDDQSAEASSCGSGGGGESEGSEGRESWRVTLDHDLVETLSAIYPEWFKPQQRRRQRSDTASLTSPASAPNTPPSDDALSWGGESSDMAGRQGSSSGSGGSEPACSPPRVSPPKVVVDDSPLQPAMDKHKESLKVKLMMRRPINQLVAQGIMPPLKTPPAYFEQCKQLERAKTGDLLKAKIQRRPDRQELERRHILEQESHVDPSLAEKQRMLKKARLADQLNDQLSHRPGPLELIQKNILHTDETVETAVKSGTVAFKATCEGASHRPQHPIAYCGPPEDASPTPSPPSTLSPISVASPCQHPAPGKDKNRKKSKQKHQQQQQQAKARFKFHEYKGPPSAQKASSPPGDDETPYELLLQQQQMLLQLMLPASPAPSTASDSSDALSVPPPPPPLPPVPPSRFEDMKVSDLRAECKRRNLRVSGPKPTLLDRLRPFLGGGVGLNSVEERQVAMEIPMSPATMRGTPEPDFEPSRNEDIVVSQRRQIEELERKLEASRRQLEAVRRDAAGAAASDQSRRLLQAHLCVSQLRAQLDALQQPPPPPPPPATLPLTLPTLPQTRIVLAVTPPHRQDSDSQIKQAPQTYILNGVKMVPIAILPTHYEAHPQVQVQQQQQQQRQETPPPPPPPPLPLSPLHGEESQIMDDVLEILVENGELPASAVSKNEDIRDIREISLDGSGDYSNSNAAADLQRELDDLQHEILQNADCDTDLAVDLLSDDFHADFGESDPTTDHNFLGSLLGGPTEEEQSREMSQAMDTMEDQDRMCVTPLTNGDILDHGRTCFEDMDDLSLPSFNNDEHCDFDLKEFGIELGEGVNVGMETEGFGCRDPPLIPNLFGRGHVPQCDPLLGGAAPRQHKHFSWDKFELDAT